MPFPPKRTTSYGSSRQLVSGDDMNSLFDAAQSAQQLTGLGSTQAGAAPINAVQVELLTSAAAGVLLPPSYPGAEVNILNNSGSTITFYGSGADVVQTTGTTYAAAATGITMLTLVCARFFCIKTGFWQRVITA